MHTIYFTGGTICGMDILVISSVPIAVIVFVVSLVALVKGADFLIKGAERIGRYFKLPAFVIGALIVGIGTSLPEVASSFAAIFAGANEIVVSNAVGSNIANILLVAGLAAVVGRRIVSTKNLLDIEVPLLIVSSSLFLGVAFDGVVTTLESMILFAGFLVYLSYLLLHPDDSEVTDDNQKEEVVHALKIQDFVMLIGGGIALVMGAQYLINAVTYLSTAFNIATGVIAISAVAVGTSLPEIIVSVTAVLRGKTDMAFGNVFGSNVFNILMMVGVVGLFETLHVDSQTYTIGLPVFAAVTLLFVISAMSKRIYIWEGLMFLLMYVFFMVKIFGVG